jgi:tetratricopeptide (TPR) repeat protein
VPSATNHPLSRINVKIQATLKAYLLTIGLILILSGLLHGQKFNPSKSNNALYTGDTARINRLITTGIACFNKGQLEEALSYYKKAREQAKSIDYEQGILQSYLNEGVSFYRKSDFSQAINSGNEALKLAQKLNDSVLQSTSINTIGVSYMSMGNNTKALSYYFKGLAIEEKLTIQKTLHWFYSNIGNLYREQKNYPKALEYSYKAVAQEKKIGNDKALVITYNNIAETYADLERIDSTQYYYNLVIKISEKLKDPFSLAVSYTVLGSFYLKQKKYNQAIEFSLKGFNICKSQKGFSDVLVASLTNLGAVNQALKKYDLAEAYFLEALSTAKEMDSKMLMKDILLSLATLYDETKDYPKAYDYYKLFSEAKDSLLNKENSKLITEMNTKYTTEKKEKEIEILKKNEDIQNLELSKKKNELNNQRTISISIFSGFLLLMLVAILLSSRYRLKKKANDQLQSAYNQIEEKNVQIEKSNLMITDSITYAKRIQDAILPSHQELEKIFSKDFFLFYSPAQIVSGDFYWCATQNNKTIFVVADCTGHGVPGAFMSMIGNTLLNEIVNEQKVTCTKEIAELLDKKIIHSLHQHTDSSQYDGMDISICCIDKKNKEIHFTGAHHVMYVFTDQLQKIKGDPYSIGGAQHQDKKTFTTQKINYREGQLLYFQTDGYCDQSGGPDNKRFTLNRFEKLLMEVGILQMEDQKNKFEIAFENWKGQTKQRDDVLLVGIKCCESC